MIKRLTGIVTGLSILLVLLPLFSVWAAGSANVTVEGGDVVSTGATTEMSLYVTASGANLGGVSFDVSLGSFSYQSFNASGTVFNGYAGVPTGGSVGSTSFRVAASYLGSGGSGKLYIGKVVIKASETAGTGQITIANVQAVDYPDEQAMSASAQNKSVTITAPEAPATTSQTSTNNSTPPANSSSQASGSSTSQTSTNNSTSPANSSSQASGSSASSTNNSTPANATITPNNLSTAAVPASAEATSDTPAAIVSEQAIADTFAVQENSSAPSRDDNTGKKLTSKWLIFGLPALVVVLLLGTGLFLWRKKKSIVVPAEVTTIQPSSPESIEPPVQENNMLQDGQNLNDGQADENYGQDQKV